MEKIYRVKLNSKGMPNFSTAEEIIHCRECKYTEFCEKKIHRHGIAYSIDFCSYGERNADSNTFNALDALDDNSSEKPNNSTVSKMEQVGKE